MKKMISICLLFIFVISGALWIQHSFEATEEKPQEEILAAETETEENKTAQSMSVLSKEKYYLTEEDGMVIIYEADRKTCIYETSIRTSHLPEQLRQEIREGVFFSTEEELYEFLENYSS